MTWILLNTSCCIVFFLWICFSFWKKSGFFNIYIPLDAAGSNLINYLKLETMGVKMITFSVGVELKNIKKNSENTFFMYLFIYNLINENHAQIMDILFPKKEKIEEED